MRQNLSQLMKLLIIPMLIAIVGGLAATWPDLLDLIQRGSPSPPSTVLPIPSSSPTPTDIPIPSPSPTLLPSYDLTMWSQENEAYNAVISSLFTQWAAEFAPGSTLSIEYKDTETLKHDISTGSGLPDFFLGPNDAFGAYVDSGLLRPLDNMFDMSLYPFNLGAAQIAGVTYGVPTHVGNHLMLMYNKSLVESPPNTWDDLFSIVYAIEVANPSIQGFAYNENEPYWLLPFVYGFEGSIFDEEGSFALDTDAWVNAYQFVHDLKFVKKVIPTECDYDCANNGFQNGTIAMILNGDWALGEYLDTQISPALGRANLGLAPLPLLPNDNRPRPFTSGKSISIPTTTDDAKLQEIIAFVTLLTTNPDIVTRLTSNTVRLPAIAGVQLDDPLLQESAAVLATGIGMPATNSMLCVWDSIRPQLEGVMSDTITPSAAAAQTQAGAEACVKQ